MTAPALATHAASIDEALRTTITSKNLVSKKLVSQTTRNASQLLHLGVGKCEIAWHLGINPRTVGNTLPTSVATTVTAEATSSLLAGSLTHCLQAHHLINRLFAILGGSFGKASNWVTDIVGMLIGWQCISLEAPYCRLADGASRGMHLLCGATRWVVPPMPFRTSRTIKRLHYPPKTAKRPSAGSLNINNLVILP